MLLLYYSTYLLLGSVCLGQGAPVTPGKQPEDAISSWTSSSSSNPTFRNHGKFQKIHITNVNTNTNANPNPHPNTHFIPPSFLTNPSPNPPTSPQQSTTINSNPRLRQIYGIFINQARHLSSFASSQQHQQHSTIKSSEWLPNTNQETGEDTPTSDLLAQRRPLGIYALIRHLRRTDRVWAPVAILFAMSWLAVVAMGVVECVGVCWQRVMKSERQRQGRFGGSGGWGMHHERVLFDGGVLDEVVIEAVPVDDDEDDGQDQEDGDYGYKTLKKM
ncbi:hypothetical protein N8T08_002963 [Aspergillus melleus]|uniref:Uncharacterized protein n=1 Tax=Aspergillus melleus TaxID=138277 RepID=A0ACC3B8I3_9EURO|nr:hypothetical protein N8T08_002963 [Aspergillus melleus]